MWVVGVVVKVSMLFSKVVGLSPTKMKTFCYAQIKHKKYEFEMYITNKVTNLQQDLIKNNANYIVYFKFKVLGYLHDIYHGFDIEKLTIYMIF